MELTPRLQAIAAQVPQGARLADVGTDHGYLPVWLLLNQRINHAIASDLREGPLNRARETAQYYGVAKQISFRLCNGLSGVHPEEVDTVAIAGMGGETIAAILDAAQWTRTGTQLLLQPMTGFVELRQWLQNHSYCIVREQLAREGKRLYSILTVRGGEMPQLTPAELWAGQQSGDPLRREYLALMRGKAEKALRGHRSARTSNQAEMTYLEVVLFGLRQMEKELNDYDHSR